MKYLQSYKLFESVEITEWSEVLEIINEIEDELNFEFQRLNIREDRRNDRLLTFIFMADYYSFGDNKSKNVFKWFINKIIEMNQFKYEDKVFDIIEPEQIKPNDWTRGPSGILSYKIKVEYKPESRWDSSVLPVCFVNVFTKGEKSYDFEKSMYKGLFEYHFNFKAEELK